MKTKLIVLLIFSCLITFAREPNKIETAPTVSVQTPPPAIADEDAPMAFSDIKPMFTGGQEALNDYLRKNLVYPQKAIDDGIEGTVIVRFVVNKKGKITNVEIKKSVSPELDKEAMRVVSSMPAWIPGMNDNKSVSVYFLQPIRFRLGD